MRSPWSTGEASSCGTLLLLRQLILCRTHILNVSQCNNISPGGVRANVQLWQLQHEMDSPFVMPTFRLSESRFWMYFPRYLLMRLATSPSNMVARGVVAWAGVVVVVVVVCRWCRWCWWWDSSSRGGRYGGCLSRPPCLS